MQRRCGCDCLAVQLMWFGSSLNSTAQSANLTFRGLICPLQTRRSRHRMFGSRMLQLLRSTPRRKTGVPMSPDRKSALIIRGTLLIIVASTVAACASTPLANSSGAEQATTSQEIDGSINSSPPEPNVWHVLRNTMADLRDAGIPIDYFFLFRVPVYIRTAP